MYPDTMNAPLRPAPREPVRHRISRAEYHALLAAETLPAGLDLELIDGELIEMPADGSRTIEWNLTINRWLVQSLGPEFAIVPDKSLAIDDHNEPKPDFWIFDATLRVDDVTGADVLLIIEIADTTLRLDLRKAEIYARAGVREYWLLDVERRRILVHRRDAVAGYGEPTVLTADQTARAEWLPGLALRLDDHPRLA